MAYLRAPLVVSSRGAVESPPEPLSLRGVRVAFHDLEYVVPSNVERGKKATVLHTMTGYFSPGEMTAIMGPSGCGKSLLMDVLAGRKGKGTIQGSITYAGTHPSEMFLRRVTGYVEQFGTLVENLTVFEMLMYTAELKRPITERYASKKRAVSTLISKLALEKCRDTKIGDPQLERGISGGQAKRVNIGIALITNPRVLFLDEPNSGLDSYTANEVMDMIKSLVTEGITLISTLHSPTPYVFNLFDKVCLLLRGRVVYFGKRERAIEFFEPIKPADVISADSDAEWLTDVIVKADAAGKAEEFALYYEQSSKKEEVKQSLGGFVDNLPPAEDLQEDLSANTTVTPAWFAVKTYFKHRTLKNYVDLKFWTTRASDKIVLTVILVSVYWGLGNQFSPENFTNILAVFAACAGLSSNGATLYVPNLFTDRWLFYRENHDGLYRVITYFLVRLIEESLVVFVISLAMSAALWYTIDLQGSFLVFFIAFLGNFWCAVSLAFLFSSISPSLDAAMGGMMLYMTTVSIYCGFYIRPADMASYVKWYSKICFMKYSFGAFIINHFESSEEARNLRIYAGDETSETVSVVEYFNLQSNTKMELIGYVYLFAIGYAVLAFLAMQYIRFERY